MERPDAVLIAGPTASGKSGLAVELARRFGGAVVNADALQVYEGLEVLTARPRRQDMGGVDHHLYGHVDPREPYSVGAWIREVEALLPQLAAAGQVPVFCGGTGLYFKALTDGLDAAPAVEPARRTMLRERMAAEGPAALHRELRQLDPQAAERIRPSDPQRIVRALELAGAASSPSAAEGPIGGLLPDAPGTLRIVLAPERDQLRAAIATRFDRMVEAGAMMEAAAFADRYGEAGTLAGKAIGLAELLAARRGETSLPSAIERAVTRSRQYAKRQETWFRNQFGPQWQRFDSPAAAFAGGTSWRLDG